MAIVGTLAVATANAIAAAPAAPASTPRNDPAAAEALFREGRKLMTANKLEAACERFAESYRLDPAPGTLLNVAECSRRKGKTATAWGQFVEAARVFRRRNEERRAVFADAEAKKLEPELAHLTVTADEPLPDLVVARDGAEIGPSSLGTKLPIDPGTVAIEARAPGRVAYTTRVEIRPKQSASVRIPRLELAPEPVVASTDSTLPAQEEDGASMRIAGIVVGGVGVAALATGGVFVALTASSASDLEAVCPANSCVTAEGRDTLARSNLYANVANGTLVAGGVLAATGALLWWLAPDSADGDETARPSDKSARIWPYFGPAAIGVTGQF